MPHLCALLQEGLSSYFTRTIPFHPLQRTEKVPPEDRESLRAWLMMACDVMHRDVGPYYRTMEAGAILDLIAGLLSSAGIKSQLCEDVAACYPGTVPSHCHLRCI